MSVVAMEPLVDHVLNSEEDSAETELHLDPSIKLNLCLVHVHVSRWTGRLRSKNAQIELISDNNEVIKIEAKKMTKPCHILDGHPIFAKIDATEKLKDAVMLRYASKTDEKGFSLVSLSSVGRLCSELIDIREQRLALVRDELMPQWDYEIAAYVQTQLPDVYKQVLAAMPKAKNLLSKFDMSWTVRPLTPMTSEELNLDDLNPEDRHKVADETNKMLSTIAQGHAKSLYDTVFGEMVSLCEKINDGSFETGRRKSSAITDILNHLERVENFGHATTPQILAQIKAARNLLKGVTITQVNSSSQVQNAIRSAFAPLGESLKNLQEENKVTRAPRALRL